jgi:hypothetical protein
LLNQSQWILATIIEDYAVKNRVPNKSDEFRIHLDILKVSLICVSYYRKGGKKTSFGDQVLMLIKFVGMAILIAVDSQHHQNS